MIGTGCSQLSESRTIMAVDEPNHALVVLHGCNGSVGRGEQATNERNDFSHNPSPIGFRQGFELLTAKRFYSAIVLLYVSRGLVDDLECSLVTGLVIIAP